MLEAGSVAAAAAAAGVVVIIVVVVASDVISVRQLMNVNLSSHRCGQYRRRGVGHRAAVALATAMATKVDIHKLTHGNHIASDEDDDDDDDTCCCCYCRTRPRLQDLRIY